MTTGDSSHSSSVPGMKSLAVHWLILGICGMVLPILIYFIARLDYFVQWQVVAQAPENTSGLVLGDNAGLMVRTTSGQILSCYSTSPNCWIPDIVTTERLGEPCNIHSAAFSSLTHPPKIFIDCIYNKGSYAEMAYTVLYARDPQGNIWRWGKTSSAYDIILIPVIAVAGAFGGVLVGSLIWIGRRIFANQKQPQTLKPAAGKRKINWSWFLAGSPLLCIVAFGIWYYGRDLLPSASRYEYSPIYTAAAATVNAQFTSEGSTFRSPVTPNPSGPAYDFACQCVRADWRTGLTKTISCDGKPINSLPSVEIVKTPGEVGTLVERPTLLFTLPADYRSMHGVYPVWEVRSGDHFRAVIRCLEDAKICDMLLAFRQIRLDGTRDTLGTWQVTGDQKSVEIDLDLSDLAGERLSFWFEIGTFTNDNMEHSVLLVEPRIENTP